MLTALLPRSSLFEYCCAAACARLLGNIWQVVVKVMFYNQGIHVTERTVSEISTLKGFGQFAIQLMTLYHLASNAKCIVPPAICGYS